MFSGNSEAKCLPSTGFQSQAARGRGSPFHSLQGAFPDLLTLVLSGWPVAPAPQWC